LSDKVFAIRCDFSCKSFLPTFRPPKKGHKVTLLYFQALTSKVKVTLGHIRSHYTLYHQKPPHDTIKKYLLRFDIT